MSGFRRVRPLWVWVALVGWFAVGFGFATLMDQHHVQLGGVGLFTYMVVLVAPVICLRWRSDRLRRARFVEGLPRPDQSDLPR